MTKITYECKYGTVTITTPKEEMDIFEVADDLLKPMLYALGYADGSIKDVFYSEDEYIDKANKETPDFEDGALDPAVIQNEEVELDYNSLDKKIKSKKGGKKNGK